MLRAWPEATFHPYGNFELCCDPKLRLAGKVEAGVEHAGRMTIPGAYRKLLIFSYMPFP